MSPSKRVNRKKLKEDIMAGKYMAKCDYSYTDDYRYDAASDFGKTEFKPARVGRSEEGYVSFREDLFAPLKSYGADLRFNEDGSISLSPHSNRSYTLRLKSEQKVA